MRFTTLKMVLSALGMDLNPLMLKICQKMAADVQEVSNLWEFTVLMRCIRHILMNLNLVLMQTIVLIQMAIVLTLVNVWSKRIISAIIFFQFLKVLLFLYFLLFELADLIQNCQFN